MFVSRVCALAQEKALIGQVSRLICRTFYQRRPASYVSAVRCSGVFTPAREFGILYKASNCSRRTLYTKGIKSTEFTDELKITADTPAIPIFRLLNLDGTLVQKKQPSLHDKQALELFKFMVEFNEIDSLLLLAQRQGRISFYIPNSGEEALQAGVAEAMNAADVFFGQYRESAILLRRGYSLKEMVAQCFGNAGEEGKGRQMPISYSKASLNIHTISTPLSTQVPQSAGAGYAFRIFEPDRVAVVAFGEGAASEGDVHAGMNFAATLKSQTVFLCRNNGYAISTPVSEQYAGDGIAPRGRALGILSARVDGNDLFACYEAMKQARELCVNNQSPVLLEFMTYRQGNHSTSDESARYRPSEELKLWQDSGADPIKRLELYLLSKDLIDKDFQADARRSAKQHMLDLFRQADIEKKYYILDGIFEDVYYPEAPWHLQEQRKDLREHILQHPKAYKCEEYLGLEK